MTGPATDASGDSGASTLELKPPAWPRFARLALVLALWLGCTALNKDSALLQVVSTLVVLALFWPASVRLSVTADTVTYSARYLIRWRTTQRIGRDDLAYLQVRRGKLILVNRNGRAALTIGARRTAREWTARPWTSAAASRISAKLDLPLDAGDEDRAQAGTGASGYGTGGPARRLCQGTVRSWAEDEGYGLIDSADTPGGCWADRAGIVMDGHRALTPGDPVTFTCVPGWRAGYRYLALLVWPPVLAPVSPPQ
jgi:cold shock CspA family protein